MAKNIAITGKVKEQLSQLLINKQVAEMALSQFMQGFMAGKELDGNYNLNLQTFMLEPIPPKEPPAAKKEV